MMGALGGSRGWLTSVIEDTVRVGLSPLAGQAPGATRSTLGRAGVDDEYGIGVLQVGSTILTTYEFRAQNYGIPYQEL